jgi:hypothetical protein
MKFLFFYCSKDCEFSVRMHRILESEGILQMFDQYDIYNLTSKELVGFGLDQVPAIVTVDNNGKKTRDQGPDAFTWVSKFIQNRRHNMAMTANANRLKILERNMELNKNNSVAKFSKAEMTGLSDGYAYLQTDLPQSKNYVGLGLKEQAIVTIQEQGKMSKQDTGAAIKNYEKERQNQENVIKKGMEESRLIHIYNNRH